MSINIHFLDVGQGNMVVAIFPDSQIMVYDCNITDENEDKIFAYLEKIMPKHEIDIFVNSHRDADHMRGIKKLHENYKINTLWDSGVSGNTEAPEYQDYMDFRRNMVNRVCEVHPNEYWTGKPFVRILNGKREDLTDVNAQSIVIHIDNNGCSVLLTGDTDAKVWNDYITSEPTSRLKSSILLASHHGALSFFDDPNDTKNYYTKHLSQISPDITIISVGKNSHGHPDKKAIDLYEKYSKGSDKGNKIFRTDIHGNIRLELRDNGGWNISRDK